MKNIIGKIRSYNAALNEERVNRAIDLVIEKYKETGHSPSHVIDALDLLLPLKPDEDSVIAMILHELYIQSKLSDDVVREKFGQTVLNLMVVLKKLMKLDYTQADGSLKAEVLRKAFLAMAKDLRVILIWLICRLHKLICLEKSKNKEAQIEAARIVMDVCVPLAARLGIYVLKTRLEDRAFKYLYPVEYKEINSQIQKLLKKRKNAIETIQDEMEKFLKSKNIKAEVSGRIKSISSIYRKLKKKWLNSIEDIFDIFAVRVVLPNSQQSVDRLYLVLGLIHSEWKPLSSKFKDFIAVPKPNGYKSLHTVVLGLSPKDIDQPVEIQIRDEQMHREAEFGIAAHWLYKADASYNVSKTELHVDWLKAVQKLKDVFESEMIGRVDLDIFKDRIFVLTPRGEAKDLPHGSVPIDFAYALHTDLGNKCVMAKVNGVVVPLDAELKNGDVVEIIIKSDAAPKLKWLSIAKSNVAKTKIKAWFSNKNRENNIKEGRILLNNQLEKFKKPLLDQNFSIFKKYCRRNLNVSEREQLVEEVGKGAQIASDVIRKIYPYDRDLSIKQAAFGKLKPGGALADEKILIGGEAGLLFRKAACCHPKKGDSIVGYTTRGRGITIHKNNCYMLGSLDGGRIIAASWED